MATNPERRPATDVENLVTLPETATMTKAATRVVAEEEEVAEVVETATDAESLVTLPERATQMLVEKKVEAAMVARDLEELVETATSAVSQDTLPESATLRLLEETTLTTPKERPMEVASNAVRLDTGLEIAPVLMSNSPGRIGAGNQEGGEREVRG